MDGAHHGNRGDGMPSSSEECNTAGMAVLLYFGASIAGASQQIVAKLREARGHYASRSIKGVRPTELATGMRSGLLDDATPW